LGHSHRSCHLYLDAKDSSGLDNPAARATPPPRW
jgi:hypothetical protein